MLKLARQSATLTQERLAEELGVDVTTVQGWESGRRPLAAMGAGDFLKLCGRLSRLGAPAATGRHLRESIEADQVLTTGVVAGESWVEPDSHPLAASVHRWTITNLILWPILGRIPRHLHEFVPQVPRRGPTPTQPTLSAEERTRFLNHLPDHRRTRTAVRRGATAPTGRLPPRLRRTTRGGRLAPHGVEPRGTPQARRAEHRGTPGGPLSISSPGGRRRQHTPLRLRRAHDEPG
ncbi:hypothetical protein AMIS_75190 [Actinoplanes missouriensis 431]|uniref:HTH cro/C1-type domain-containing protein n=1 Tax=Actinoplanes missouriensis (strain ATCC 14538 / DSM 43046 / CBS 188.64 / JCM 3121 / NBRC 102363 / NCIMB 12654 / NRRL B-3342 / UNCC 431) TaxID=512565 RepID=I0HIA2_ACTM4|nr:hypothetical protein AMIS_75190 [Actinoplanes missouriensis 431]